MSERLVTYPFGEIEALYADRVTSGKDLYADLARDLFEISDDEPVPCEFRNTVKNSLWICHYNRSGRLPSIIMPKNVNEDASGLEDSKKTDMEKNNE